MSNLCEKTYGVVYYTSTHMISGVYTEYILMSYYEICNILYLIKTNPSVKIFKKYSITTSWGETLYGSYGAMCWPVICMMGNEEALTVSWMNIISMYIKSHEDKHVTALTIFTKYNPFTLRVKNIVAFMKDKSKKVFMQLISDNYTKKYEKVLHLWKDHASDILPKDFFSDIDISNTIKPLYKTFVPIKLSKIRYKLLCDT